MNLAGDKIKAMGNLLPIPFLMPLNLTSVLSYFPTLQVHHCLINLILNFYEGRDHICLVHLCFNKSSESICHSKFPFPIPQKLLKIPLHSILHGISLSAASPKSTKQNAPYTLEVNIVG